MKTKLFKWAEGLKPKFPKFVENLFGSKISDEAGKGESVGSVPAVNVESKNTQYDIEVAVPGLEKDDISIQVEGNVLTISSEKQYSHEDKGRNFLRQEFGYAAFSRSFALPKGVDADAISARMESGILKIGIPSEKGGFSKNVQQIKVK